MVSESGGEVRRQGRSCDHLGLQPPVQENLPCPRCQSTSTKFCYYNNYNMSQPRYFCKGCRRYWTHGGTLRNIPVGGGTRKSTPAAKRPRTTATSPSPTTTTSSSTTTSYDPTTSGSVLNLNQIGFSGLLQLGGYGYGYDEMGYGLVRGVNGPIWAFPEMGSNGTGVESAVVGGGRSMMFPMSGHIADGGGWSSAAAAAAEVECYGWPELAISSMSGNTGLK